MKAIMRFMNGFGIVRVYLCCSPETLKCWIGVRQGQSYLMGEGASLAIVGHPSSDDVTIKMVYGEDVLH